MWQNRSLAAALAAAALAALPVAASAQNKRDTSYYTERWQEMAGDCGETEACCARQLKCLVEVYREVSEDAAAGRVAGSLPQSMNTMAVFAPLRTRVMRMLTAPSCPADFRKTAYNTLKLSSRFAIDDAVGTLGSDNAAFFDPLLRYLSSLPEDADAGYLDCTLPVDQVQFPDPPANPVEMRTRRAEAALEQGDPVLAQIYLDRIGAGSGDAAQRLRLAELAAEAALALDADAAPAMFASAVESAQAVPDTAAMLRLQERLADVHFGLQDVPGGLAALSRLVAMHRDAGNASGEVSALLRVALVQIHLQDEAAAEARVSEAEARARADGTPVSVAEALMTKARVAFEFGHGETGCTRLDAARDWLSAHELSADETMADLSSRYFSCEDIRAYRGAEDAAARLSAAIDADDWAGAVAAGTDFLTFTEQPRVAEAIGPQALAEAQGTLSWAHLLLGDPVAAEEAARAALALYPGRTWIELNLAHARLLQGDDAAARTLYHAALGTRMEDGTPALDVVKEDLAALRLAGLGTPSMDRIEAELDAATAEREQQTAPDRQ